MGKSRLKDLFKAMFTGNTDTTFLGNISIRPTNLTASQYLGAVFALTGANGRDVSTWGLQEGAAIASWIYSLNFGETPKAEGQTPNDGAPAGWTWRYNSQKNQNDHSDYVILQREVANQPANQYIVAIEGSTSITDWLNNFAFSLGVNNNLWRQMELAATNLYNQIGASNFGTAQIVIAGQSLGAGQVGMLVVNLIAKYANNGAPPSAAQIDALLSRVSIVGISTPGWKTQITDALRNEYGWTPEQAAAVVAKVSAKAITYMAVNDPIRVSGDNRIGDNAQYGPRILKEREEVVNGMVVKRLYDDLTAHSDGLTAQLLDGFNINISTLNQNQSVIIDRFGRPIIINGVQAADVTVTVQQFAATTSGVNSYLTVSVPSDATLNSFITMSDGTTHYSFTSNGVTTNLTTKAATTGVVEYRTAYDTNGKPIANSTRVYFSKKNSDGTYAPRQEVVSEVDKNNLVKTLKSSEFLPSELLGTIGSTLGNFVGGNTTTKILASAAFSAIGLNIGQSLEAGWASGNSVGLSTVNGTAPSLKQADEVWNDFGVDFFNAMRGAIVGSISSYMSMELGKALGLKGFGGELFGTVSQSVLSKVVGNISRNPAAIFADIDSWGAMKNWALGNTATTANVGDATKWNPGAIYSAIGAFLGAKLGALVVTPQTQAAAVLSSVGSAAGAWAFGLGHASAGIIGTAATSLAASISSAAATVFGKGIAQALGNILVPGFGAFLGFVIGALIGNLFGRKKPKVVIPTANAETVLQIPYARYELGALTSANGGSLTLARDMAANARDILNGFINQITKGDDKAFVSNIDGATTTQAYGHTGTQLYVKIGGTTKNVNSAEEAVEHGVLTALRNTKVVGGDIFLKRIIARDVSTNMATLAGDLQTASDYATYRKNRGYIEGLISEPWNNLSAADKLFYTQNRTNVNKILAKNDIALTSDILNFYNANKTQIDRIIGAASPTDIAAGWIVTLQRASELKLGQFANSDFYGGLRGFLDSFNLRSTGYEYASISQRMSNWGGQFTSGATISYRSPNGSAGPFGVLSQALSGPVGNDVRDGRFTNLNDLWEVGVSTTGAWGRGVNLNADWSGNGNDVLFANMAGTTTGLVVDQYSDWIASQAGTTYETSVYAAQHRGLAVMSIVYYDANRQVLRSDQLGAGGRENLGAYQGKIENFDLLKGASTAPTGTAYRRVQLRLYSTGGSDPYAFFTRPTSRAVSYGNDVRQDRFQDLGAWTVAHNVTTTWGRTANMVDWYGNGNDVLMGHITGATNGPVLDQYSDFMATTAGTSYESSVYAAQHRGSGEAWVQYLDANKNHLAWVKLNGTARESGAYQGLIENFNLLSGTSVAPAGSAYRRIMLRLQTNGGSDPYAFFTLPVSRPVSLSTTNWETSGHNVYIDQMSKVGYSTTGTTTAGNDLIDKSGSIANVTLNDLYTYQVWVSDPGGGHYEPRTIEGGDDIFIGGQGNDTLYGRSGWDWLDGGAGDDWVYGGTENDVLIGGAGRDILFGEAGNDYLASITGNDDLYGGDGDDTLVSGTGGDNLIGGVGSDTLLLSADRNWNWAFGGGAGNFTDDPSGNDAISAERFESGVRFDLDYRPSDWNAHPDASVSNPASRLAEVYNAAGNQWLTSYGLVSIESATGSHFGDKLYGTVGANTLKGLSGNDLLDARDGNDVVEGGAGADTMYGGNGVDVLSYEGSEQGVSVDLTANLASGGDAEGDTWTGFEHVRGSRLSDELKGDGGQNRIEGLAGDDWIVATGGGTPSQTYTTTYNPYTGYQTYPTGWTGGDIYDGGLGLDTVDYSEAAAGVVLNLGSYTANATSTGGASGSGSGGLAQGHSLISIEAVVGSKFGDTLTAGAGEHNFEGGKGDDGLSGGAGADTYFFSRGDGIDVIYGETNADANNVNYAGDIKFSDFTVALDATSKDLLLTLRQSGPTDRVRVNGNFATDKNNLVKSLSIGNASMLDISQINVVHSYATAGNDVITGQTLKSDWMLGYEGNDTLYGSGSNGTAWEDNGNVFVGGKGNDSMVGFLGEDQYAFDRGDGTDTISDSGGEDTVVFGAGVKAEDVIFEIDAAGHLYIGVKDIDDPTRTASLVQDKIKVINGGKQTRYKTTNTYRSYSTGQIVMVTNSDYIQHETIEYVLAGGTSIDLKKVGIAWQYSEVITNNTYYSPIVLDLDGDGMNLTSVDSSNVVARDSEGYLTKIAWVGPTDGFLAVDRNGDGQINQLSEISFVQDKLGAKSDLEGLKTWDANGDGLLDKNDAGFGKLLLFTDLNQNGRSSKKELKTLAEAGIAAIDLNGVATGFTEETGSESFVHNTMKFIRADGSQGNAYDVALALRNLDGTDTVWGRYSFDGTLGQLRSDQKEIKKKGLVDFSDHDKVDDKVMKRWAKMSAGEFDAWMKDTAARVDARIQHLNSDQIAQLKAYEGAKATRGVIDSAFQNAEAAVTGGGIAGKSDVKGGKSAKSAAPASASAGGSSGAATSGAPDLAIAAAAASQGNSSQAWWQDGQDGSGYTGTSLSQLLAALDAPSASATAPTDSSDPALAQQQLLLLQSMAAFGSDTGGSAAVWNRNSTETQTLAASAGLTTDRLSTAA